MKKAISLVLTVVMLFAVCVPAFAATVLDKSTPSGQVTVETDTHKKDGSDAADYCLTIPADTKIPWGEEKTDVSYTIESHLMRNKAVSVKVTTSDDTDKGTMKTDAAKGDIQYLPYTLDGAGVNYSANHPVVFEAEKQEVNVLISRADWNKAIVESYSDILTYTAELVTIGA